MDEKPKSIWKKTLRGWRAWLLSSALIFAAIMAIGWMAGADAGLTMSIAGILVMVSLVLALGIPLFRWLFWKHWRRGLFALACFATLIALFYAEEDWRGWHAWNQFKHEWEAKGEHFDFASVVPPPVPDEQNFAMAPVVASCYERILDKNGKRVNNTNVVNRLEFDLGDDYGNRTNGMGNWAEGKMTDLKLRLELFATKTNLFTVPPPTSSPAHDVLQVLGKFDATVEELRQASQLPQCRFPLDYGTECPADIVLPHLAALKKTSLLLKLRAIAELQNGQSPEALADVQLMLRLTETMRQEPILISHLVRLAMLQFTLQPIYEGLAEHRWSDAQLIALDAELAKLNFLADYKLSMRGEMGLQNGTIDYLRRHPQQIPNVLGMFGGETEPKDFHPPLPVKILTPLIPTGWFDQNRLRLARITVEFYLPTADEVQGTASPAGVRRAEKAFEAETKKGTTPYNIFERVMLPALGAVVKKFAYGQASVDLARVAIALERYRLAHGEFPESLDALAPQFIAQVPHDVIGGQPLKYRRTANPPSQGSGAAGGQFVLYSVGWNEKDDGGVVGYRQNSPVTTTPDISQGDWVWRYPQKK